MICPLQTENGACLFLLPDLTEHMGPVKSQGETVGESTDIKPAYFFCGQYIARMILATLWNSPCGI